MRINNHSELVFNVLSYATRTLEQGDESLLLLMGFLPEEIRAIEKLSLKHVKHLSELGTHFMDFRIDHACLKRVIANLERDTKLDQLRDDLLRAGAPAAMMAHYWGMTSTDCAIRRRVLEIETPPGRPPKLGDDALEELWNMWRATEEIDNDCERYLKLAQETGISLATIWPVVEEWKTLEKASAPVSRGARGVDTSAGATRVARAGRKASEGSDGSRSASSR